MAYHNLGFKRKDKLMVDYLKIIGSEIPEVERVAKAFTLVTDMHIREADKEIELARAMGDQENLVKEQIKQKVIEFVQDIFNDAYWRLTGRKVEHVRE